MKSVASLLVAAVLAASLAGCGTGQVPQPTVTVTVTITASPQASSAASPAASTTSAITNERLFAHGDALAVPVIPSRVVTGRLMRAYARFQHAYGAAWGAVGQPYSDESVTQIARGFELCPPNTGNGSNCDTFTHFTTNQAEQITGVSVDGEPVAGRIATAPDATSDGLTISNVVAYRLTGSPNVVGVAFKLTDHSYRPVNTSPSLLASLSGASDDVRNDALPATLQPGDSLYAEAGFDISQITGLFCLQPNDGFGEHLPCTTLRKV